MSKRGDDDFCVGTLGSMRLNSGSILDEIGEHRTVSVVYQFDILQKAIQCDELCLFVYPEQKSKSTIPLNVAGNAWTFNAIDADSKLLIP